MSYLQRKNDYSIINLSLQAFFKKNSKKFKISEKERKTRGNLK